MPDFVVTWSIDIFDAENAIEAAKQARIIQLNPESIATVFEVQKRFTHAIETIDLEEIEESSDEAYDSLLRRGASEDDPV